jgi:tetratricopeptide (TPR) repeat protein
MRRGDETVRTAMAWVSQLADDVPLFLWVHLFDPHRDWNAPEPWSGRFDPYRSEIYFTDTQTAFLLEVLAARGRLNNAFVVLTSDHGEGLGEHEQTHGYFAYDSTLRIPLLFWAGPKTDVALRPGATVEGPVSLVDIAPTLREVVGLPARESNGKSLVAHFSGEAVPARDLPIESTAPAYAYGTAPIFGVATREGEVWFDLPRRERYDLRRDPDQLQNVYGPRDGFRADALFRRFPRDWPPSDDVLELDPATEAQLGALGYVFGTRPGPSAYPTPPVDPKDRIEVHEFITRGADLRNPERMLQDADALYREHGALPALALVRSDLLGSLGRTRDAFDALSEAAQANPDYAPLQRELGRRRQKRHAARREIDALRRRLAGAEQATLRWELAVRLQQLQEFEEAERLYRELIDRDHEVHAAGVNLVIILIATGRLEEAREHLAQLLAGEEFPPNLVCAAGRLLSLHLDRREEGRQVLRRCFHRGGELSEIDQALLAAPGDSDPKGHDP